MHRDQQVPDSGGNALRSAGRNSKETGGERQWGTQEGSRVLRDQSHSHTKNPLSSHCQEASSETSMVYPRPHSRGEAQFC